MKVIIVSIMLFGLIAADVSHLHRGSHFGGSLNSHHNSGQAAKPYARILKSEYVNDGHGTYNFAYETENGISHNEDGATDNSKRGQYSYTGDDGKVYTVMYWADESGFHAVGDHLPGSQNQNRQQQLPNNRILPKINRTPFNGGANKQTPYNYPKPSSGYDYSAPKNNYLPPKTGYLPPAPSTDYLPPKFV